MPIERFFQTLFRRKRDSMNLTETQKEILKVLVAESGRRGSDGSFTYQTEWLGYLPFGQYCWVKIGEEHVSDQFPSGWELSDLDALVAAGLVVKLGEKSPGEGGADSDVLYRLQSTESGFVSAGE